MMGVATSASLLAACSQVVAPQTVSESESAAPQTTASEATPTPVPVPAVAAEADTDVSLMRPGGEPKRGGVLRTAFGVTTANLIGDALRDFLDPKLKQRIN